MVQFKKSDPSYHFYKAIVNKKSVPSKFQRVFVFVCDLCKNQIRQRTKQKQSRRELSLWLWIIRVNEDVIENKKLVPSKFQRVFVFVCDLCKNQIRQQTKEKKSRRELSWWLWIIRVNEDVIDNINYAVQDVHVICATI
jgi:uncharacterized protein YlaI